MIRRAQVNPPCPRVKGCIVTGQIILTKETLLKCRYTHFLPLSLRKSHSGTSSSVSYSPISSPITLSSSDSPLCTSITQLWATDRSLSPLHGHGTVCRQPYGLHRRSPPSDENGKHFFFTPVFRTTSSQFTISCYVMSRYLIDCVECPCSVLRDSVT